ncbi:hypothetical protein [Streptomyces sp. NPDC056524]|uniref:hypothetical protein n=1 Tax=Streptomyces sp. NPDC056524 TaxID=3345851 RepID=UPI0036CA5B0D
MTSPIPRAQAAIDKLGDLAKESAPYTKELPDGTRHTPETINRELLRIRKQELAALQELQNADPNFRPAGVADGIKTTAEEITRIESALEFF